MALAMGPTEEKEEIPEHLTNDPLPAPQSNYILMLLIFSHVFFGSTI